VIKLHGLTVEHHCARATRALIATFLRTGQLQLLSQHVQQRGPYIDVERAISPVDAERHCDSPDVPCRHDGCVVHHHSLTSTVVWPFRSHR